MLGLVLVLALIGVALILAGLILSARSIRALREGITSSQVTGSETSPIASVLATHIAGTSYPVLPEDSDLNAREMEVRHRLQVLFPTVQEAAFALEIDTGRLATLKREY